MHLPQAELPPDTPAQRRADRRRLLGAFNASLAGALLLCLCYAAQQGFDVGPWTVIPGSLAGLRGVLTAPLLHGSGAHLLLNALSLLALGSLAGIAYPKATWRALPLLWIGSGLGAWLLGEAGSHHLGGALAGVLAAFLFRRSDPALPRRRYSWEIEEELAAQQSADGHDTFEPPSPTEVPVLWHRREPSRGVVLRFPERRE
jgi:membrane associated rhomboid family serine protease